jgi:hypothetical protein
MHKRHRTSSLPRRLRHRFATPVPTHTSHGSIAALSVRGYTFHVYSIKSMGQAWSSSEPSEESPDWTVILRTLSAFAGFLRKFFILHERMNFSCFNNNRSAGPMARRLTTNQEIAGSIPASINETSSFVGGSLLPYLYAMKPSGVGVSSHHSQQRYRQEASFVQMTAGGVRDERS